jgi:TetR/AcrR family transcriptional regulator, regulator of cefoperazone and chloramphenicol sensitivity
MFSPMVTTTTNNDITTVGTRERLLAAGLETFAEQGYRAATVREICKRAHANVAAINYHFRDKAGLYGEVLRNACKQAMEKYPLAMADLPADPAQRLRLFVRQFLGRIFDPGLQSAHGRLMAREMIEPTEALDRLVEEAIRPQCELLQGAVREILGAGANEDQVRWGAMSVVGQCVFYHHCRAVIDRLYPQMALGPELIDRLSDHIAAVSIAGLRSLQPLGAGANGKS